MPMPGTTQTIGARIRSRRVLLDLSQSELARRLEIDKMLLYKWETGRCKPSLSSAERLAEALEVTVDWLVAGRESKFFGNGRAKRTGNSSGSSASPAQTANA